jgi:Na+/glutamate symporter
VVIDTAVMITRPEFMTMKHIGRDVGASNQQHGYHKGEGARASCHGIIKVAKVAAARGAKAAETVVVPGVKVVAVSLHRTLTR